MKAFALGFIDALRGGVALVLIALAVGVVAEVSLATTVVMVVAAVLLAASGRSKPEFGRR